MGKIVQAVVVFCAVLMTGVCSDACVGKTIFIGIPDGSDAMVAAEMAAQLITERTGSSVKIERYKNSRELYAAVQGGKVHVIMENTPHALEVLGRKNGANLGYDFIKSEYRKTFNMTWLAPFGTSVQYAAVLTSETLANYPALPKLLNKLAGALGNDTYRKLSQGVGTSEKARQVARDFLKSKKLI